jgi:hypothetical protein
MRRLTEKEILAGGVLGLLAAWGLASGKGRQLIAEGIDLTTRGKLVTNGFFIEALGIVTNPAADLLRDARAALGDPKLTMDEYALARMIRSEGATQGEVRAHVALNDLKSFRFASDLYELLTYSTDPNRRGYFGMQYSPAAPASGFPAANKRRYSTKRDPYEVDIRVARNVIADRKAGIDKARGATKFIDKSAMGVQKGTVSFAQKDAEWKAGGYQSFTLPEFGDDFVLYRRA